MANTWPIVRTQRTMPTPGIRSGGSINIDFNTGEVDVWRQVGNLAATGMDVATRLYLKQAEDQYATAQILSMQDETGYAESLRKETDETKYDTMLDSHIASQDNHRPKNPLAAKEWDRYVVKRAIDLKKSNEIAKEERLYDKWQTRRDLLTEQGNIPLLRQETAAGIALGYDESEAMEYLRKAEHVVTRQEMESMAGNDPDKILKYDTPEKMKKAFLDSLPADFAYIRGLASNQKNYRLQKENEAMSAFYTDVSKKAEEGVPLPVLRELIRNQPGISTEEKERAMRVANSAYSTWGEGGTKENPWKSTQDYNALMEMQIKISQGQPVTEMDIWAAQLAQLEKGPLFSRADALNLISQLPDKKDKTMMTPFADEWMNHIDAIYLTKDKIIPRDEIAEWAKTRQSVEVIIKSNYPNVGKAQKEIEEFLKPMKKKKARGLISTVYSITTGILSPTGFTYQWVAGMPVSEKLPVHIESPEEAVNLNKGEKFEYKGTVYTRK